MSDDGEAGFLGPKEYDLRQRELLGKRQWFQFLFNYPLDPHAVHPFLFRMFGGRLSSGFSDSTRCFMMFYDVFIFVYCFFFFIFFCICIILYCVLFTLVFPQGTAISNRNPRRAFSPGPAGLLDSLMCLFFFQFSSFLYQHGISFQHIFKVEKHMSNGFNHVLSLYLFVIIL